VVMHTNICGNRLCRKLRGRGSSLTAAFRDVEEVTSRHFHSLVIECLFKCVLKTLSFVKIL
jgi:hypothetical protein